MIWNAPEHSELDTKNVSWAFEECYFFEKFTKIRFSKSRSGISNAFFFSSFDSIRYTPGYLLEAASEVSAWSLAGGLVEQWVQEQRYITPKRHVPYHHKNPRFSQIFENECCQLFENPQTFRDIGMFTIWRVPNVAMI